MARVEMRAFVQARQRFVADPSLKRLRELRGAIRRLRSLFDDFHDFLPARKRKALSRLLEATAQACQLAALRKTLQNGTDQRERPMARPILRSLRNLERRCFREAQRAVGKSR